MLCNEIPIANYIRTYIRAMVRARKTSTRTMPRGRDQRRGGDDSRAHAAGFKRRNFSWLTERISGVVVRRIARS